MNFLIPLHSLLLNNPQPGIEYTMASKGKGRMLDSPDDPLAGELYLAISQLHEIGRRIMQVHDNPEDPMHAFVNNIVFSLPTDAEQVSTCSDFLFRRLRDARIVAGTEDQSDSEGEDEADELFQSPQAEAPKPGSGSESQPQPPQVDLPAPPNPVVQSPVSPTPGPPVQTSATMTQIPDTPESDVPKSPGTGSLPPKILRIQKREKDRAERELEISRQERWPNPKASVNHTIRHARQPSPLATGSGPAAAFTPSSPRPLRTPPAASIQDAPTWTVLESSPLSSPQGAPANPPLPLPDSPTTSRSNDPLVPKAQKDSDSSPRPADTALFPLTTPADFSGTRCTSSSEAIKWTEGVPKYTPVASTSCSRATSATEEEESEKKKCVKASRSQTPPAFESGSAPSTDFPRIKLTHSASSFSCILPRLPPPSPPWETKEEKLKRAREDEEELVDSEESTRSNSLSAGSSGFPSVSSSGSRPRKKARTRHTVTPDTSLASRASSASEPGASTLVVNEWIHETAETYSAAVTPLASAPNAAVEHATATTIVTGRVTRSKTAKAQGGKKGKECV
ncbi:hypothetical protein DFP72DRAFT_919660 [Ephemerocybe angulata]|uniref:Uncharacterized protein n=1 Tax=Ephemerocybe angulata TaxID=980116 RepID=A0A8H6HIE4_9AGAR|nr:hypothetical protein DFP72DRAFT_919660 [Tulosesus angulatus]